MKNLLSGFLLTILALLVVDRRASSEPHHDFAGLVDIGENRSIYLECRGSGSPIVVLVSGAGGAFDEWTHVLPQIARFTRVCAYDRPGTRRFDNTFALSTIVPQPTTAQNGVADLHALLTAANEAGPYVLVGASWGGLIAKLYATTYPNQVAGLILVDGATEFFQETLTPEQWADWMQLIRHSKTADNEVPDYEQSVTHIRTVSLVRITPSVVLTSDKPWDLQVGTTGSSFPAWLAAQERLAAQLNARHITQTNSSHGIAVEQPQVVVDAVRDVVDQIRVAKPRSRARNPQLEKRNVHQKHVASR
jgi:pimeloyl-ACP methyl ester carboxylesterase